jgi:alkylhydroperoxidase/carboxymuconolactone decarboxylase family protein YurZ
MTEPQLPPIVQQIAADYPEIWAAYNELGRAAAAAHRFDGRQERLLKLALAVGGRLQGAVRSQVRRARALGIELAELKHVALLSIPTIGWPSAVAALSWIEDEWATVSTS